MPSLRGHRLSAVKNDTDTRAMCGPTAVASITGKPLSRVHKAFGTRREDGGASKAEIAAAMRALGFRGNWHPVAHRPTLASWVRCRLPEQEEFPCIIHFDGHFAAASGDTFCDTKTGLAPVNAADAPEPRRQVQAVFVATSRAVRKRKTKPKPITVNEAADFRRAVKAAGATYELDHDPRSYSNAMEIKFADGRSLHLRHIPSEWSEDIETLKAFIADPTTRRFYKCSPGVYVTNG